MENINLLNAVPYIISLIALIVSIASYLLNKKIVNENRVFEEKIRSYYAINVSLDKLMTTIIYSLHFATELIKVKHDNWENELDEHAGKIDEAIEGFNSCVAINGLLIPSEVLEQFDKFDDFLERESTSDLLIEPKKCEVFVDKLSDNAEALFMQMREDLNADRLNKGLQKRLRGNWERKFLKIDHESINQ